MTQFTGSARIAEKLARDLGGRVKLEDAGFDWKILGPDVHQVRAFSPAHMLLHFLRTLSYATPHWAQRHCAQ